MNEHDAEFIVQKLEAAIVLIGAQVRSRDSQRLSLLPEAQRLVKDGYDKLMEWED